jgi:hypothetical protein
MGHIDSRERRVGKRVPELIQELICELGTVLGVAGHVGDKLLFGLALALKSIG